MQIFGFPQELGGQGRCDGLRPGVHRWAQRRIRNLKLFFNIYRALLILFIPLDADFRQKEEMVSAFVLCLKHRPNLRQFTVYVFNWPSNQIGKPFDYLLLLINADNRLKGVWKD